MLKRTRPAWCQPFLLLALASLSASGLVLAPGPELSLELNDVGRVSALSVNQLPRPVQGLGGWEVTDLAAGSDELRDCPMTVSTVTGLGQTEPEISALVDPPAEAAYPAPRWLLGGQWRLETAPTALRTPADRPLTAVAAELPAESVNGAGSLLRLVCPVREAVRGGASFTVQTLVSGATALDIGLLGLSSTGRATTQWQPARMSRHDEDWQLAQVSLQPPPDTAGLLLVIAATSNAERLRCAGGWLTTHWTGDVQPLSGQVTATADGARFEALAAGLHLRVDYQGQNGALHINGALEATDGADHVAALTFRLPLDGRGWRWQHGLELTELVPTVALQSVGTWLELGSHLYSPWPLGCMTNQTPAGALTIAQPRGQAVLMRFGFRPEFGLFASFDVGLSPGAGRNGADFELFVFASEPRNQLRGALDAWHALQPAAERTRPAPHGSWFIGVSPQAVPEPRRFGLRYDEQPSEHLAWMARHDLVGLDRWRAWSGPADLAVEPLPPAPEGSSGQRRAIHLEAPIGGPGAEAYDLLDPALLGQATIPLSVDRTSRRPALPLALWRGEQLRAAAAEARANGRWLVGAPPLDQRLPWLVPLFDGLLCPTTTPPPDYLLWLRALAPSAPLTWPEPDLLNATTLVGTQGDLWSKALLAGAFPGAIGLLTSDLTAANASLVSRGFDALNLLSGGGWQPLTYAYANDELVSVQRYGTGDRLALVLHNRSDSQRTFSLALDPQALGLGSPAGGSLPSLVDRYAPDSTPRQLTRHYDQWQTGFVLEPNALAVLVLGPPVKDADA